MSCCHKSKWRSLSLEKIIVNIKGQKSHIYWNSCCSVAKLCLTPKGMPGFHVLHHLPEFVQTHVHWVSDAIQPSHPLPPLLLSCSLLLLPSIFLLLPRSQLFASGGQNIGASASAPVLPMNIQGWFPLGLTGWISLQSKGLSRVFSSTTVWKHQLKWLCPFK